MPEPMLRLSLPRGLAIVVLALLLGAACAGGPAPTPIARPPAAEPAATGTAAPAPGQPTATPTHTEEEVHEEAGHEEDLVERGREVYSQLGCAACHGENAEGNIGPPLPGHTAAQIRKQVRAPVGAMPALDESKLSDEDLEAIIAYISSLPMAEGGQAMREHAHGEEPAEPGRQALGHIGMAILALKTDNLADARHHLGHLAESLEPADQALAAQVLQLLDQGEHHQAEHALQDRLADAGVEMEGTLPTRLHLELAKVSLEGGNTRDGDHHLAHALETASGEEVEAIRNVRTHLAEGEAEEALHLLEELLAGEGHHP